MSAMDYLNQRTTNINIRISPILKTQLIESGVQQGLNLSDYVMHVLTMQMIGSAEEDDNEEEVYENEEDDNVKELYSNLIDDYNELSIENEELQIAFNQYEKLTTKYENYIGQTLVIDGKEIELNTKFEVLENLLKSIKYESI